jgi:hypothetical protein
MRLIGEMRAISLAHSRCSQVGVRKIIVVGTRPKNTIKSSRILEAIDNTNQGR